MKKTYIIIATIITTLNFTPVFAAEGEKAEHKHEKGEKHDDHAKKVQVNIPETAAALWTEIDAKWKALTDLIAAKKSADLHAASETVEALVNAVPEKHIDLPSDKKKRVEGMAKNIARSLDAMHEEGEEGHWDDVAKRQQQIDGALKLIKAQTAK